MNTKCEETLALLVHTVSTSADLGPLLASPLILVMVIKVN